MTSLRRRRHGSRTRSCARAAAPAIASPCNATSTGTSSRCISPAFAPGSCTCRSTSATRSASSSISSTTRRRKSSSAGRKRSAWSRRSPAAPRCSRWTRTAASSPTVRAGEPAQFDTVHSHPDDLAAIVYTSGTTGRSKGASLTHRNLASNALALVEAWAFTRGDVLLHALPIYHVHGLFVAIHCTLLSGARMLWLPKFDAARGRRVPPGCDGDDGRAHVLYAIARAAGIHARGDTEHPALRVGIGAAVAGNVRRVSRANGAADPRALRDDRNRHDRVQSARRHPRGGNRRPPASRHQRAHRRCRSEPLRAGCDRRRPGPRSERVCRLLANAREDARRVHRRRVVSHRRSRPMGRRRRGERLPAPRRARQGHDHQRRTQRLPEGDRGAHRRAPRHRRIGGDRRARSRFRRSGDGGRRRCGGACRRGGDGASRTEGRDRGVQGAEARARRRRIAAQRDGQGAEERAARALRRSVGWPRWIESGSVDRLLLGQLVRPRRAHRVDQFRDQRPEQHDERERRDAADEPVRPQDR